jgi:hypothetical protein
LLVGLRGLSNNGTASGDSGLENAELPPLAVRMWINPRLLLLIANRFTSAVPGCGVIDDGPGTDLALSCRADGAHRVAGGGSRAGVAAGLRPCPVRLGDPAQLPPTPAGFLALYTYFHRDFRLIQMDSFGDLLYKRVSGSVH